MVWLFWTDICGDKLELCFVRCAKMVQKLTDLTKINVQPLTRGIGWGIMLRQRASSQEVLDIMSAATVPSLANRARMGGSARRLGSRRNGLLFQWTRTKGGVSRHYLLEVNSSFPYLHVQSVSGEVVSVPVSCAPVVAEVTRPADLDRKVNADAIVNACSCGGCGGCGCASCSSCHTGAFD